MMDSTPLSSHFFSVLNKQLIEFTGVLSSYKSNYALFVFTFFFFLRRKEFVSLIVTLEQS